MRLFVMAFVPCLRAQPSTDLPPPSGPNAEATYESLMLRWARASSSTHRCLEAQARQPPRSLPPGPFWTIGVEGAGHHMIEAMDHSLCKGRNNRSTTPRHCGGQESFPCGVKWRRSATISPSSQQKTCASLLRGGENTKFIFLVRDPVDATVSTLGRFWNHNKMHNDTLMGELTAARLGWRHVVECIRELPCERSLFLSYELLALFPQAHTTRLAAFLGTSPTDEHVLGWLRSVRPPNDAGTVRASWEAALSPSAPTGAPYSCSDAHNTVVANRLQAEVALWHKHDEAWRQMEPWIAPSIASYWPGPQQAANPFPWPQDDDTRVVEPPWMRACDAEWAVGGTAHATPAYLTARCLDAFRAALRQWFYGKADDSTDAFPRAPLSREPCTWASTGASTGASPPSPPSIDTLVRHAMTSAVTSVGSTLNVHDGMTLHALAAAVKRANISICLTVTEHFGNAGFGDTMAFRLLPLKFATAHKPHLRYQFAPIGTISGGGTLIHHMEQFAHMFSSAPEGSGCKLDGSDGRKMPAPLCARVSNWPSSSVYPAVSVKPIAGGSMWTLVGDGVINGSHVLQDGDTVTICNTWGKASNRHTLKDHDARSVRTALMDAYYRGASEPRAIAEAHAAHTLAVSVHVRNGDTAPVYNGSSTQVRGPNMRYTRNADLMPLLRVVAELPLGCVSVLVVTELAEDEQVREFTRWFAGVSQNRTAVTVFGGQLCDGPCAFHTLAQSDVLVSVTSGFSYTAAMVTKDNATLAFAGHEGHGEDHDSKQEFNQWREHMGRPYVTTPAQLSAALRSRLPVRCHVAASKELALGKALAG